MSIAGVGNHYNVEYEKSNAVQNKKEVKDTPKEETIATEKKLKNGDESKNYLGALQKKFSNLSLTSGNSINWKGNNKTNNVMIHPNILAKMENDENAAKEYAQRLSDIEAAFGVSDKMAELQGGKVTYRCDYIDENGTIWGGAIVEFRDSANEKLREEAQENAQKRIDRNRELAGETEEEQKERKDTKNILTPTEKLEQKIADALSEGKGKVEFDNKEMDVLIEEAKKKGFGPKIDRKV